MTLETAVSQDYINTCFLMDLEVDNTTYYITDAYKEITHNSNTYTPLGHLLAVGGFVYDAQTGVGNVDLALSGIPTNPSMMSLVLGSNVKGSSISIYRAFMDVDTRNPIGDGVYLRFKGYVDGYTITEDNDDKDRTNTVSLTCHSHRNILHNKVSGRRTNPRDMKRFYSTDTSFDNVPTLHNKAFDFGMPYRGNQFVNDAIRDLGPGQSSTYTDPITGDIHTVSYSAV